MRWRLVFLLAAGVLPAAPSSFDALWRLTRSPSPGLASALEAWFCESDLRQGTAWASEGSDFVWALESQREPQLVVDGQPPRKMRRIPGTHLWYATGQLQKGRVHAFEYRIEGKPFGGKADVPAFGPYSYLKPGTPPGRLSEKFTHRSRIYPGMECAYWVYAPAAYDATRPAAVMIWQDGEVLVPRELPSRAQIVFDNLTHEGKIPVIVLILISPGFVEGRRIRSEQYDEVSDRYARFLLEEILPAVEARYPLRKDGYSRALAGDSSGGVCAFNAVWHRPEEFSRVLSRIGSFTSIQWKPGRMDGGNIFPFWVRKAPRKNLRVWLQDSAGDLENEHGSWPAQNLAMANALKLKEYDFHFSWGEGGHSRNHGHVELAEEMVWLWRDYDPARAAQQFEMDPAERGRPFYRIQGFNRK